jgi:hypothetical protein
MARGESDRLSASLRENEGLGDDGLDRFVKKSLMLLLLDFLGADFVIWAGFDEPDAERDEERSNAIGAVVPGMRRCCY